MPQNKTRKMGQEFTLLPGYHKVASLYTEMKPGKHATEQNNKNLTQNIDNCWPRQRDTCMYVTLSKGIEWVRCWEYWFELTGLLRWQIRMIYIVVELQKIVNIAATRCPIEMWFGSKCDTLNGQMIYIENQNWLVSTCDSFPLIVSHIMNL